MRATRDMKTSGSAMMKETESWFKSLRQGYESSHQSIRKSSSDLNKSLPELNFIDCDYERCMELAKDNQRRRRKAQHQRVYFALSEHERNQRKLLTKRRERAQSVECFLRKPIRQIESKRSILKETAASSFADRHDEDEYVWKINLQHRRSPDLCLTSAKNHCQLPGILPAEHPTRSRGTAEYDHDTITQSIPFKHKHNVHSSNKFNDWNEHNSESNNDHQYNYEILTNDKLLRPTAGLFPYSSNVSDNSKNTFSKRQINDYFRYSDPIYQHNHAVSTDNELKPKVIQIPTSRPKIGPNSTELVKFTKNDKSTGNLISGKSNKIPPQLDKYVRFKEPCRREECGKIRDERKCAWQQRDPTRSHKYPHSTSYFLDFDKMKVLKYVPQVKQEKTRFYRGNKTLHLRVLNSNAQKSDHADGCRYSKKINGERNIEDQTKIAARFIGMSNPGSTDRSLRETDFSSENQDGTVRFNRNTVSRSESQPSNIPYHTDSFHSNKGRRMSDHNHNDSEISKANIIQRKTRKNKKHKKYDNDEKSVEDSTPAETQTKKVQPMVGISRSLSSINELSQNDFQTIDQRKDSPPNQYGCKPRVKICASITFG